MSCKQVLCVHLYSTANYFFSCCVLVYEDLSLNSVQIYSKYVTVCCTKQHAYLPDSVIDKPNAKSQSVFPVRWRTENSKKLSFLAGGLFEPLPSLFPLTSKTASYAGCCYVNLCRHSFLCIRAVCSLLKITLELKDNTRKKKANFQ